MSDLGDLALLSLTRSRRICLLDVQLHHRDEEGTQPLAAMSLSSGHTVGRAEGQPRAPPVLREGWALQVLATGPGGTRCNRSCSLPAPEAGEEKWRGRLSSGRQNPLRCKDGTSLPFSLEQRARSIPSRRSAERQADLRIHGKYRRPTCSPSPCKTLIPHLT